MKRWLTALPLIAMAALAGLFLVRLGAGDASSLPSALVGRAAPAFSLPPVLEGPGLSDADLRKGQVTVLNVFASWCAPCRVEHPNLMGLSRDAALKARGVQVAGIAYKDAAGNAASFLTGLGNPYGLTGLDLTGRTGLDFGVYGVPETYIVRGDGVVLYRHVGPISEDDMAGVIRPQIEKALRPLSP